jgi:hypothetical protein
VENGRPGDEEAGERLIDDLGAAEKEDVVAPLPDGVEGPVGIVDAHQSLRRSPGGGGDPDRATEIDEQASWGAVGRRHEQPGSRHGAAANDAARLDAMSTGPARAIAAKPTMTAAASANIEPRDRAVMGHLVRFQEGMPTFGSPGWRCSNSIATVVVPAQAGIQRQSHLGLREWR